MSQVRSQLVAPDNTPEEACCPVIDAHNHLWGGWDRLDEVVAAMDATGVAAYCDLTADITLSWEGGGYRIQPGSFATFLDRAARRFPGRFYGFTTAGIMRPPEEPLFADAGAFVEQACRRLREDVAAGAMGLKLTKELGLLYRDTRGNLIACDDERLRPLWAEAARLEVPVLIHQADPVAFFSPPGPENEHDATLRRFPDWNFSDSARFPAFAELQRRYRNLVASNPDTVFFLPHCANWPENLDFVGELLDALPNARMDFSARVDELGRQPYRAREWILRYQDRLFFGTDMPASVEMYRWHWRFLETFDEDLAPPFYDGTFGRHRWKVHGLGLPREVLEKLYHANILKFLPRLREKLGGEPSGPNGAKIIRVSDAAPTGQD